MEGGEEPTFKKVKMDVNKNAELIWIVRRFPQIFPLLQQDSSSSSSSSGSASTTEPISLSTNKKTLTCETFIKLRSTDILHSEVFEVVVKDVQTHWRICLHKEIGPANEIYIGIELHLVGSCKKSAVAVETLSKTNKLLLVPININVSLTFCNAKDEDLYLAGTVSHSFQQSSSSSSSNVTTNSPSNSTTVQQDDFSRSVGLVWLIKHHKVIELATADKNKGVLRLKFGLNFININNMDVVSTKNNLLCNLGQLLKSGVFSDFTIVCGSESFRVHKSILSIRCCYFKTMFNTGLLESDSNKLEIHHMEPIILKYVLVYIYTSSINSTLSYSQLTCLIQAFELYQLEEAKQICFGLLLNYLDETNAGDISVLGLMYNAALKYRIAIFEYISKPGLWASLTKNSHFQELVVKHPHAFFNPSTTTTTT